METATDTTQAPAVESAPAENTEVASEAPAPEAPKAFDPASIAPEIQEHYKKQYADYDNFKNESAQFRQITGDQRFQKWANELNNPTPAPAPQFQITEEEHNAALTNPAKFQELVMKAAEFTAQGKLGPQLQQAQREIEFAKAQTDLSRVVKDHPEFIELDKKGLIEPILRKYPGMGFEDAMDMAKAKSGWIAKQIDDKARGQVQTQKKAISEKGGTSSSSKGKKSFANREEAMKYAYSEAQNGREVDPEDIDIA